MTRLEKMNYMNACYHCKYRKESGEVLNQYGVGRCLPMHCTNPNVEPDANKIYHLFRQDNDDAQWDIEDDDYE